MPRVEDERQVGKLDIRDNQPENGGVFWGSEGDVWDVSGLSRMSETDGISRRVFLKWLGAGAVAGAGAWAGSRLLLRWLGESVSSSVVGVSESVSVPTVAPLSVSSVGVESELSLRIIAPEVEVPSLSVSSSLSVPELKVVEVKPSEWELARAVESMTRAVYNASEFFDAEEQVSPVVASAIELIVSERPADALALARYYLSQIVPVAVEYTDLMLGARMAEVAYRLDNSLRENLETKIAEAVEAINEQARIASEQAELVGEVQSVGSESATTTDTDVAEETFSKTVETVGAIPVVFGAGVGFSPGMVVARTRLIYETGMSLSRILDEGMRSMNWQVRETRSLSEALSDHPRLAFLSGLSFANLIQVVRLEQKSCMTEPCSVWLVGLGGWNNNQVLELATIVGDKAREVYINLKNK